MATKHDLPNWILEALRDLGGRATIVEVAKHIWTHREGELKDSGDLFYTWQYDMRWGAQMLRKKGKTGFFTEKRKSEWVLIK